MAGYVKNVFSCLRQMEKNLECSICLELLKNPYSTKCNHQFCWDCIHQVLEKSSKKSKNKWFCPLCKKPVSKRSLTPNPKLASIVDAVKNLQNAVRQDNSSKGSPPSATHDETVNNAMTPQVPVLAQVLLPNSSSTNQQTTQATARSNLRRSTRVAKGTPKSNPSKKTVPIDIYEEPDAGEEDLLERPHVVSNTNISSSFPAGSGEPKKPLRKAKHTKPTRRTKRFPKTCRLVNAAVEDDQSKDLLEAINELSFGLVKGKGAAQENGVDIFKSFTTPRREAKSEDLTSKEQHHLSPQSAVGIVTVAEADSSVVSPLQPRAMVTTELPNPSEEQGVLSTNRLTVLPQISMERVTENSSNTEGSISLLKGLQGIPSVDMCAKESPVLEVSGHSPEALDEKCATVDNALDLCERIKLRKRKSVSSPAQAEKRRSIDFKSRSPSVKSDNSPELFLQSVQSQNNQLSEGSRPQKISFSQNRDAGNMNLNRENNTLNSNMTELNRRIGSVRSPKDDTHLNNITFSSVTQESMVNEQIISANTEPAKEVAPDSSLCAMSCKSSVVPDNGTNTITQSQRSLANSISQEDLIPASFSSSDNYVAIINPMAHLEKTVGAPKKTKDLKKKRHVVKGNDENISSASETGKGTSTEYKRESCTEREAQCEDLTVNNEKTMKDVTDEDITERAPKWTPTTPCLFKDSSEECTRSRDSASCSTASSESVLNGADKPADDAAFPSSINSDALRDNICSQQKASPNFSKLHSDSLDTQQSSVPQSVSILQDLEIEKHPKRCQEESDLSQQQITEDAHSPVACAPQKNDLTRAKSPAVLAVNHRDDPVMHDSKRRKVSQDSRLDSQKSRSGNDGESIEDIIPPTPPVRPSKMASPVSTSCNKLKRKRENDTNNNSGLRVHNPSYEETSKSIAQVQVDREEESTGTALANAETVESCHEMSTSQDVQVLHTRKVIDSPEVTDNNRLNEQPQGEIEISCISRNVPSVGDVKERVSPNSSYGSSGDKSSNVKPPKKRRKCSKFDLFDSESEDSDEGEDELMESVFLPKENNTEEQMDSRGETCMDREHEDGIMHVPEEVLKKQPLPTNTALHPSHGNVRLCNGETTRNDHPNMRNDSNNEEPRPHNHSSTGEGEFSSREDNVESENNRSQKSKVENVLVLENNNSCHKKEDSSICKQRVARITSEENCVPMANHPTEDQTLDDENHRDEEEEELTGTCSQRSSIITDELEDLVSISQCSHGSGHADTTSSRHLDSTSASSFMSDFPIPTQDIVNRRERVKDVEDEMEALRALLGRVQQEKQQAVEDDEANERDAPPAAPEDENDETLLSLTPPPPLTPHKLSAATTELPSPLKAVSRFLREATFADLEDAEDDEENMQRCSVTKEQTGINQVREQDKTGTRTKDKDRDDELEGYGMGTTSANVAKRQTTIAEFRKKSKTTPCKIVERENREKGNSALDCPTKSSKSLGDERNSKAERSLKGTKNLRKGAVEKEEQRKGRYITEEDVGKRRSSMKNAVLDDPRHQALDEPIDITPHVRRRNRYPQVVRIQDDEAAKVDDAKSASDDEVIICEDKPTMIHHSRHHKNKTRLEIVSKRSPAVSVLYSSVMDSRSPLQDSASGQGIEDKANDASICTPVARENVPIVRQPSNTTGMTSSSPTNSPESPTLSCGTKTKGATRTLSFVTTRLSRELMGQARKLAHVHGGRVASEFNKKTTHVIMTTDENSRVSKNSYTMKYLLGLALGKWIVSHLWIRACLEANTILPEEQFEVKGDRELGQSNIPKLARLARSKERPLLFRSYRALCIGDFQGTVSRGQLEQLLDFCGAQVCRSVKDLTRNYPEGQDSFTSVVMVDKEDSAAKDRALNFCRQFNITCVTLEWVTDSIGNFSVQAFELYELKANGSGR